MRAIGGLFVILGVSLCVNAFNLEIKEPSNAEPVRVIEEPKVFLQTDAHLESDDLCAKLNCKQGEKCSLPDGVPTCECNENCEPNTDERLMVCSTSNVTFETECHFYREKCWCLRGDNKCMEKSSIEDSVDYFGKCQSLDKCLPEHMEVFPRRMQLWLDKVLITLSDRKDLDERKYGELVRMAREMKKQKVEKYWTYGVVFEFCQLDKSHDFILNIDEMKELTVPIKSLENCLQPFLQSCDANKDSKITDQEWGNCLDLTADDLKLLRKAC